MRCGRRQTIMSGGIRRLAWCAVLASLGVAACGDGEDASSGEPTDSLPPTSIEGPNEPPSTSEAGDVSSAVIVPVAARATPATGPEVAGEAITEFGLELFAEVRAADPAANVTVSPASVAIALAMLEPGTVETAQEQMRTLLRIDDPAAFHDSMNSLEQDLEARTPVTSARTMIRAR